VGDNGLLLWVVMITSAENRPWPGDVSFGDAYEAAGLPIPSVVRPAKIASLETRRAEHAGRVAPELMRQVDAAIATILGDRSRADG
jgi:mRNA interferase MazF